MFAFSFLLFGEYNIGFGATTAWGGVDAPHCDLKTDWGGIQGFMIALCLGITL